MYQPSFTGQRFREVYTWTTQQHNNNKNNNRAPYNVTDKQYKLSTYGEQNQPGVTQRKALMRPLRDHQK
jgi:hypothetical protein